MTRVNIHVLFLILGEHFQSSIIRYDISYGVFFFYLDALYQVEEVPLHSYLLFFLFFPLVFLFLMEKLDSLFPYILIPTG